jgi:hypothetical protein
MAGRLKFPHVEGARMQSCRRIRRSSAASLAASLVAGAVALGVLAGCGPQSSAAAKPSSKDSAAETASAPAADAPAPIAGNGGKSAAHATSKAEAPAAAKMASASSPGAGRDEPKDAVSKVAPMTIGELVPRRDLWPSKVALVKPFALSPSEKFAAGQEFDLYDVMGATIALDTGQDLIEVPTGDTDILARASAFRATLTPEESALTDKTLVARPELWPTRVKLTHTLRFDDGTEVKAGKEVSLRKFEPDGSLNLGDRSIAVFFKALPHETDVITRARERLKLPEKERTPFFARSIAASLEPLRAGASAPAAGANLENADYIVVLRARLGCERCAGFAPDLAAFYQRVKAEHPNFEVVFYSDDKNVDDAHKVASSEKFPGRILGFDRKMEAADLSSQSGELLPLVFVYDKNGKLVTKNHPNGGKPAAKDVLATLEQKLAAR